MKINISSRGIGKINDKGKVVDYKIISFDYLSNWYEKIILRKERKEKLDKLCSK